MAWSAGSVEGSDSGSVLSSSSEESCDNSTTQSTCTINIQPQDGCVLLGDKQGASQYITRYCINHKKQRSNLHIISSTCCPFAEPQNSLSCCAATWSVLHSECFLFTCHMLVLLIGLLKEIFYMRQWDEDLHLVHTILENSICILVILIRMLAVYCRYRDMKKFITDNEYVSETFRGSRSVRIAMVLYILLAVCMMTVIGGCFAVFYLLAHLGWTVLITNFALTLMYVAYIIFMEQLNTIVDLIRTDQHKAVIHESVLLLKEGLIAVSGEQRLVHYQRTNRFLTALRNTDLFTLPPYIHVIDGFDYEAITLKELESSV